MRFQKSKPKILLIEDDASIVGGLKKELQVEGYEVAVAGRGGEGLAQAKEHSFDVVITDLKMPGLSGLELVEQLHASKPKLPIILMTAFGTTETAIEATKLGAYDYLLKPFDDARFGLMLRRIQARIAEAKSLRSGKRIAVRGIRDVFFVKVDDIDWIGAADYYARLHVGARVHLLRRTITELERELDPAQFRRIHRSTIVNLARVMAVGTDRHGLAEVRLGGGVRLRLSQRYRDQLRSALGM